MTGPTRTAEARWFGRGPVPSAVEAWFASLGPVPTPEVRTDRYLAPTDAGLGVKLRRGDDGTLMVEAKRREATGSRVEAGPARAPVETWTKWSFPLADSGALPQDWIQVGKQRRQHHQGSPEAGCSLELTMLTVSGETWWTVALEATAADAASRERLLRHAAARWLGAAGALPLGPDRAQGYPAWLQARGADRERS